MRQLDSGYYYDIRVHRLYKKNLPSDKLNTDDNFHKVWKDRTPIIKKRHARRVVLLLSNSCNLACSYCYASKGSYGKQCVNRIKSDEIDDTLQFLEKQFPEGIEQIQFFGGEPLLEPKAMDYICNYLESSDVFYNTEKGMVTNGTIVNEEILSMMKRHNLSITVSVDGTEKYHDTYRRFKMGNRGSYDLVTKNIVRMIEAGVKVYVQFTISAAMIDDYEAGLVKPGEIAENFAELGIDYIHLSPVIAPKKSQFHFSSHQMDVLLKFQQELMYAFKKSRITDSGTFRTHDFLRNKVCNKAYCGAGLDEISIDMDGTIYPCFMFVNNKDFILGSITQGIVNNELMKTLENNRKDRNANCSGCFVKDVCNACVGANYIENGDIYAPSKVLCSFQDNAYFTAVNQIIEKRIGGE